VSTQDSWTVSIQFLKLYENYKKLFYTWKWYLFIIHLHQENYKSKRDIESMGVCYCKCVCVCETDLLRGRILKFGLCPFVLEKSGAIYQVGQTDTWLLYALTRTHSYTHTHTWEGERLWKVRKGANPFKKGDHFLLKAFEENSFPLSLYRVYQEFGQA